MLEIHPVDAGDQGRRQEHHARPPRTSSSRNSARADQAERGIEQEGQVVARGSRCGRASARTSPREAADMTDAARCRRRHGPMRDEEAQHPAGADRGLADLRRAGAGPRRSAAAALQAVSSGLLAARRVPRFEDMRPKWFRSRAPALSSSSASRSMIASSSRIEDRQVVRMPRFSSAPSMIDERRGTAWDRCSGP